MRRETSALVTDSDDDCAVEKDECNSLFSVDGAVQEASPATSTGTSIASAAPSSRLGMSAEAYPLTMVQGNPARPIAHCGVPLGLHTPINEFFRQLRPIRSRDRQRPEPPASEELGSK